MNRTEFLRFDRTALVYRFSQQVEDASQSFFSNRDRDRSAGVDAFHTALETVGCTEGNAANATAAKVLLNFAGQVDFNAAFVRIDFNGVVNRRQFIFREFYVKRRPDYLRYETNIFCGHIKVIGVKQC